MMKALRPMRNVLIAVLLLVTVLLALYRPALPALAQSTMLSVVSAPSAILPGQVGTFVFRITNYSDVDRTFSLISTTSGGVSVTFPSGNQVPVCFGCSAQFPITALVPASATPGSSLSQSLLARSGSPTILDLSTFFSVHVGGATPTPTHTPTTGMPTITPTLGPVCRDGFEPDNLQAQARDISVNAPQTRALCPQGDEDWLRFRGVKGKRYLIDVPTISAGVDPALELFDAAGTRLAYSDDRSDDPPDLRPLIGPITIEANGDYYIRVRDVTGGGGLNYTYSITLVGLGGGSGPPPIITGLPAAQNIYENQQIRLGFTVVPGEGSTASLEVTVTASDPTLFPPGSLTISGSGPARTLQIAPETTDALLVGRAQRSGPATITITAREVAGVASPLSGAGPDGAWPTSTPTSGPPARANAAEEPAAITSQSIQVHVLPPPWLAMLYLAGDDTDYSASDATPYSGISRPMRDLIERLNRMPYNPAMRLVVLFDGNQPNGGDSRVYVREPDGLRDLTAALVDGNLYPGLQIWGNTGFPPDRELDSGNPDTLHAFVRWAQGTYPSSHTFLSVVDHGGGWAPSLADLPEQPGGRGGAQNASYLRGMAIDMSSGGTALSTRDTRQALEGIDRPIDVLFFDACLMGMIESAYEVRQVASYYVAGQSLLFAWFPYDRYLARGQLSPGTSPAELAVSLVNNYNSGVNPQRNPISIAAINLGRLNNSGVAGELGRLGELFGETAQISPSLTFTMAPLITSTQDLSTTLRLAYGLAQRFDENGNGIIDPLDDPENSDSYVDIASFLGYVQQIQPAQPVGEQVRQNLTAIRTTAQQINDTLLRGTEPVILRHRQASGSYAGVPLDFSRSTGLSIYLPLGKADIRPEDPFPNQLRYYTNAGETLPCSSGCNHLEFTLTGAARGWGDWLLGSESWLDTQFGRSRHNAPNPPPADLRLEKLYFPTMRR